MEAWPNMYKEKIVDVTTGEVSWRDYTSEEIKAVEKNQAEEEAKLEAEAQRVADKAVLLQRLGITEDEAKLLLG
jgi:hypothetical protein